MEEEEEIEDGLNGIEEEEEEEEDDEPIEDSEEEIFSSSKHRTLSHHEGANLNGQSHLGKLLAHCKFIQEDLSNKMVKKSACLCHHPTFQNSGGTVLYRPYVVISV